MSEAGYGSEVETLWISLAPHIEWADDRFSLVFLFTNDARPALDIQARIEALLAANGQFLRVLEPSTAADIAALTAQILAKPSPKTGALWISLWRNAEQPRWDQARVELLHRLNERRFLLERDLRRPLLLVLPSSFKSRVYSIAPDLWVVRSFSEALPRPSSTIAEAAKFAASTPTTPKTLGGPSAVEREWTRLKTMAGMDGQRFAAADGIAAIDAALERGDVASARQVALEVLSLLVHGKIDDDSLQSVRSWSVPELLVEVDRLEGVRSNEIDLVLSRLAEVEESSDQFDTAAVIFQRIIERAEAKGQRTAAAVAWGQIGTVRMRQERYADALAAYRAAQGIFEQLGDPREVAASWHQIAVAHERAEQYEPAEQAYRHALAIEQEQHDRASEASTRAQIGGFFGKVGRLEEAVASYREAAAMFAELGNGSAEGSVRTSLADVLLRLSRPAEAREEALRAIACHQALGHAGEIWKAFATLSEAERALGNIDAADLARRQAMDSAPAYRDRDTRVDIELLGERVSSDLPHFSEKYYASPYIFVSYANEDQGFVTQLREALEALGSRTWVDARRLSDGERLESEILTAIRSSRHVLAVLGVHSFNSTWVQKELREGLRIAAKRPGFKVIPLLLPPMPRESLNLIFPEQTAALHFDPASESLDDLLPKLRMAFGDALPDLVAPAKQPEPAPMAELVLALGQPTILESEGKRRAKATAQLVYEPPPGSKQRSVKSRSFEFVAPIGPIEAGELAWYLESFAAWPSVKFRPRAAKVEADLERWGRELFAACDVPSAKPVWRAFAGESADAARCFSVEVDPDPPEGLTDQAALAQLAEAATQLLGLPWELLHDERGFVIAGARGIRVRRRLPNRAVTQPMLTSTPIRVLVVSPRPEDDVAPYLDHRLAARPLVDALMRLGERVDLHLLETPTLQGLAGALDDAQKREQPYHVVHFDGHGIYDRKHGLGTLCFEDPADAGKLEARRTKQITADELATVMRGHRFPLVFLEACQTAKSKQDLSASVAGRLLQAGVASVVALSHSVLVATARRFVDVFYRELSRGESVGTAMLAGRRALLTDPSRGLSFHGELHLHDWFVPVLYQEELDPQIVTSVPSEAAEEGILARVNAAFAGLRPYLPKHGFVGRSRELLKVERLLARERWAVLVGEGGEGKTAIAVELGRWLVESRRFARAAFVSVEDALARDVRAVLASFGEQLVGDFARESGGNVKRGWLHLERALRDRATLLILDNMESILPGEPGFEPEVLDGILAFVQRCIGVGDTRVVFTSRSELTEPFVGNVVRIGRLTQEESVQLIGRFGAVPADEDEPDDIEALVETAQGHARSLVVLAREIAESGVGRTQAELHALMAKMQARYPEDRERSLFASVELSLRRLPAGMRERIRRLGVFQGGGHLGVIAEVLGIDSAKDEEVELARRLVAVGLAEELPFGYLRLHPALPPLLRGEMSEVELAAARGVWVEAMVGLVGALYEQKYGNAQLASVLTQLELPNLLATLELLRSSGEVERVVSVATRLETLLQHLGRPKTLARVVKVREEVSRRLGAWSHARADSGGAAVDRLLDAGRVAAAVSEARALVRQAEAAGDSAYPEAAYDLAVTYFRLGRSLKEGGANAEALARLQTALDRFDALTQSGDAAAAKMASACLFERGDCLRGLGRLDEAARDYETAIARAEASGDQRNIAVGKGQLGIVRMLQQRHEDALAAYHDARETFEQLGELRTVAQYWHQIGVAHQQANQFEAAERVYQRSLTLKVQQGDRSGEASTLGQLGNLYTTMGRLEDATRFYRDAATIFVELGNKRSEGLVRNNLANTLIELEHYDEAREELRQAIECGKPFGHTAEPWTTFHNLSKLERAVGNADAAALARQQAIDAYLAYRRDGGENHSTAGQLALVIYQAITSDALDQATAMLDQLAAHPNLPNSLSPMLAALRAILAGSRDPALASDPALDYDDTAELLYLLESLKDRSRS